MSKFIVQKTQIAFIALLAVFMLSSCGSGGDDKSTENTEQSQDAGADAGAGADEGADEGAGNADMDADADADADAGAGEDMDAGVDAGVDSEVDSNVDAGTEDPATIDLNGSYDVNAYLNDASAADPNCDTAFGTLVVTGTTITGNISADIDLVITGEIASDLSIIGGYALNSGEKFADYTGRVDGEELGGDWNDNRGCVGTWRAVKQ